MNIGVDIDNVTASFDNGLLKEYLKHDKELRNTGIVNEKPDYIRRGMFDWSKEEEENFYKENIERIATNLKPVHRASETISKLRKDGNKIYIITGRENGEYKNPKEMTINWLEKNNVEYDKLIFTDAYDSHGKTVECIKNNIDIMIEDSTRICTDLNANGIKVFQMETRFNNKIEGIERVSYQ